MQVRAALVAALFGVVACNSQSSATPDGRAGSAQSGASGFAAYGNGAGDGGAATAGGDAGSNESLGGAGMAGTDAGSVAMAGSNMDCGVVAAPSAWSGWVMPNPVRSGLPNPMSYTVSASGNAVTDNVTGLIWQRAVADSTFTWADAKQYCSCLSTDGESDWRLPSRIELSSIADWTTAHPSIDSVAFPNTPNEAFWSASVLENGDPDLAWHVDFDSSHTSYTDKLYTHHARCVRAGTPDSAMNTPPGRYMITDGTVLDTQTKLTWQQVLGVDQVTWADAATYCAALSLAGTGWRVPSISELQTIVNETTNPAVAASAFPMTPSEYFWSSSAVSDDATRAWDTFFANGSTYSFAVTMQKSVRCVR